MTAAVDGLPLFCHHTFSAVGFSDVRPEMFVSQQVTSMSHQYGRQRHGCPAQPDVAFVGGKKTDTLHACFWHKHSGCEKVTAPLTRTANLKDKFERRVERNQMTIATVDEISLQWQLARKLPAKNTVDFADGIPENHSGGSFKEMHLIGAVHDG